jgi:hypothetical protein
VDPDHVATFVLAVMEGGVMQARTYRSLRPFEDSMAVVRDYFHRLMNADTQPGGREAHPRGSG